MVSDVSSDIEKNDNRYACKQGKGRMSGVLFYQIHIIAYDKTDVCKDDYP